MIYEVRVEIVVRDPRPVSHNFTCTFLIYMIIYLFSINGHAMRKWNSLDIFMCIHVSIRFDKLNLSQYQMNCLAVWLENFNNSENSYHFTGYFRRLWCTGFRQRHPELSCPGILLQSKTWCVSKDIMSSLLVNLHEL